MFARLLPRAEGLTGLGRHSSVVQLNFLSLMQAHPSCYVYEMDNAQMPLNSVIDRFVARAVVYSKK